MMKTRIEQSCMFLSVSSNDSWYKGITSVFRDVEMYPKIRSINENFQEVIILVSTNNQRALIRRINNLLKKNVKNVLILSQDNGKILVYCTIKNREKSLTRSLSKFYDLYGIDYFWEVKNGKEEWLFSGPVDNIKILKEKIDNCGLGYTSIIEQEHEIKYELEKQSSLFKALGLSSELSAVLALAKIKGLLDNPKDKNLQNMVSHMLGISTQQLMCMVEDGVIKSMWIVEAIHNMEKKLHHNRIGFTDNNTKAIISNFLSDFKFIEKQDNFKLIEKQDNHCNHNLSSKEHASLTNSFPYCEKSYSQISFHVISNLILLASHLIRNFDVIKEKLQNKLLARKL